MTMEPRIKRELHDIRGDVLQAEALLYSAMHFKTTALMADEHYSKASRIHEATRQLMRVKELIERIQERCQVIGHSIDETYDVLTKAMGKEDNNGRV
jgi:hypothetical protein